MTDAVAPTSVVFVCWGNICRSPMAERVARRQAADAGLDGVTFTSAGVSAEESGNPIDSRARAVLTRHGYEASGHHAHQITASEIAEADLVIGLEPLHLDRMRSLAPGANNLALLTDFDPDAPPGSGVPDPWYGDTAGFEDTLACVEAAMPGILAQVADVRR
ncbi:low molecular weight protein-tyrosine-phosphatase [Propioniciclava flava]|uniref:protein-tyrosine-phosphatase n=1 Tax=Propioniciclava flava TaxID=2072026 RepID=A0A4Q2EE17_9ACTN|nr:low molecular weight protein-tyrosine-phosphatase [Propioniciclava flava]RXW31419.1 low molecular weight phosphotyrosine protein phosphatase [Propioniciclava flava]